MSEPTTLDFNFWLPIKQIIDFIETLVPETKDPVLEITNTYSKKIFKPSTKILEWFNYDKIPSLNPSFVYSRHILEKMPEPSRFLKILQRFSKNGFIETTSPLVECLKGIHTEQSPYKGHLLNRYIIWVSPDDHILHILPKYSIFEYLNINEDLILKIRDIIHDKPHYWNTYYVWNEENPLTFILYEHGKNCDIQVDYARLVQKSIEDSVKSINQFLSYINKTNNII